MPTTAFRTASSDPTVLTRRMSATSIGAALCGLLIALGVLSGDTMLIGFLLKGTGHIGDPLLAVYEIRWLVVALSVVPLGIMFLQWSRRQRLTVAKPVAWATMSVILLTSYGAVMAWWSLATVELVDQKLVGLVLVALYMVIIMFAVSGAWGPTFSVWFWRSVAAITVTLALLGALSLEASDGRIAVLGGGPNIFGRLMGLGVYALFLLGNNRRRQVIALIGAAVLLMMMVFSGSRGAMVAFAGSGLVVALLIRPRLKSILIALPVLAAVGAAFYYSGLYDALTAILEERIVKLLIERRYSAGRDVLYHAALEMGLASFWFGEGLAGFSTTNIHTYPHNLLLEFFAEGGVVGLGLVLMTLYACGRVIVRTSQDRLELALRMGLWVYLVGTAMFSGAFYDSRLVFLLPLIGAGTRLGDAASAPVLRGRFRASSAPRLPAQ